MREAEEKRKGLQRLSLFSLPIIRQVTSRSMLSAIAMALSRSIGVCIDEDECVDDCLDPQRDALGVAGLVSVVVGPLIPG